MLFLSLLACGKRRPPLPPVERIPQRTELLSGVQRGNQVLLSWPAPLRNATPGNLQRIERIDIYRLAENPASPLPLTEEDYAARATLIGSIEYPDIAKAKETLTFTDNLTFAGAPTRLRYALRYVNSAGQRAAFSNFLLLEPATKIALPPNINEVNESEAAIVIKWQPPVSNIDGSGDLNIVGYNLYRTTSNSPNSASEPLNGPNPVTGTVFSDAAFQFGEQYSYVVRAVSVGSNGQPVESLNSNSVLVTPVDRYPPSAPANLSLAVSPNGKVISLFFPANPERDVIGYKVYRSTDANLPKANWLLLTPAILERTTWRDEKVESGRTYYYYVIALDNAGNASQPSQSVSETTPE
jgi:hypothetical protein